MFFFFFLQLYSAGNEIDRRSFLDSLFSYMQEQGKRKIKKVVIWYINNCFLYGVGVYLYISYLI